MIEQKDQNRSVWQFDKLQPDLCYLGRVAALTCTVLSDSILMLMGNIQQPGLCLISFRLRFSPQFFLWEQILVSTEN